MINVALPKGRLGEKVYKMLEKAGYACDEFKECGTKRVYIGGGREGAHTTALVLLERGVAVAYSNGGTACLVSFGVVLLGKAEVYEHGVVVVVEQYVGGLYVEVHHSLAVHKGKGVATWRV